LKIAADRDAAITPIDQFALHGGFGGPADLRKAALERHPVIAAVGLARKLERLDGCESIGHLGLGDEIAAPELDAVDAELGGGEVEQPLAKEVGLVASRPPISPGRRLVAYRQRDVDADVGNAVRAGEHLRDVAGGGRTVGADVGALVGGGAAAQRSNRAVPLAGDLELAFGVAGMIGGGEMLAAILDPLHRTAGQARRERDQEILRIELAARAEAAADVVL